MGSPSSRRPGAQYPPSPHGKFVLFASWAAFAFLSTVAGAQPPTERARTEALARRASQRLLALQREADRMASDERTLLGDLRTLEIERRLRAQELKRVAADVVSVQAELDATAARVDELEAKETSELPELRRRLVEVYKLGQARYLRLLLATPDLRRLGQSARTVAALAALDRQRVESHQRSLSALRDSRMMLAARRGELTALRSSADKAQAEAERAVQARSELVRDIDHRRDLNAQLASELQVTQQKLQAMLRDMANGTPTAETAALPLSPFRGDLSWPVNGTVKRRFSQDSASNGIEIAADEGVDAAAVHDGVVAFAGTFAGFGNLVILEHGSQAFSLYGDLLALAVTKGARVERGQAVGTVGPTPSGPDGLYFELRVDGRPVDPLQWLKKR